MQKVTGGIKQKMIRLYVYKKEKPDGKSSYYSAITGEYKGVKSVYYLLINFKKGMELESNATIDIKKFYFTSYKTGVVDRLKIVVVDYDLVDKSKEKNVFDEYNEEKEEYSDAIGL